jgi:hypothetical protein
MTARAVPPASETGPTSPTPALGMTAVRLSDVTLLVAAFGHLVGAPVDR